MGIGAHLCALMDIDGYLCTLMDISANLCARMDIVGYKSWESFQNLLLSKRRTRAVVSD